MHKLKKHKLLVLLLTMVLLFGVSAQSTLAYLQAAAEPVKNTFVPVKSVVHDLDISVTGEKVLQGRNWQDGDSFVFILQSWNNEKQEWETKGTESVTYDDNGNEFKTFDMSGLVQEQLTEPGRYVFRVLEGKGSLEGVTYDESVRRFDVRVTADDTGAMDITAVTGLENTEVVQDSETADFAVTMTFTNKYTEPPKPPVIPDPADLKFDITIKKSVQNNSEDGIGPGGFKFEMEKNSTGDVWTKESDNDGYAAFHMTFDKNDIGKTFIYVISEVDEGQEGVTYDNREYEVKVGIELDEASNKLVPTITLDGKQVSQVEVDFKNIYEEPTEPSEPSDEPTTEPTEPSEPSDEPTTEPTEPSEPSDEPTTEPTDPSEPSDEPTTEATDPSEPSDEPTTEPTDPSEPSDESTTEPTDSSEPSDESTTEPTDPTQESQGPGKDQGTQTGDDFSMFLYIALMITSAIIMILLFVGNRRKMLTKH